MFKEWLVRNFVVLTTEQAKEKGLKFTFNVYGDKINTLNCRSVWENNKGKRYRVQELYKN
ncbi:hypothetical protein Phi17218_104 [Cellulophaga phage phi17:2_18]|uniref:Uncharacterized protein n=2 Tax=Lightbulbvirus Cba172 TaxID=1918525 RepID=R9ZZE8_9CAUD|nr:hypothetical protein Phi17:2_gp104 [Cellulophaga phage phi17:2]AGO47637.1 hypothetical protein Phi17:2_gp104 [Cellulophaga phage phi17:2]ALO80507.1 hypothetical protein Phi17218_104 [Cellulophaga phage phi17:2_18]